MEEASLVHQPGQAGFQRNPEMSGSFIRATSALVVADSLLTFHLTGSLLHAASTLLGHVMSGLSSTRQGETADA